MNEIHTILDSFLLECNDLIHSCKDIPVVQYDETDPEWCFNFYRQFVALNKPARIKNAFDSSTALKTWNFDYLLHTLGDKRVTVAITPNGYADGLATKESLEKINNFHFSSIDGIGNNKQLFLLPDEVKMSFTQFVDNIKTPKENYICYIQKQNSNLTHEYPELCADIDVDLPWAHRLFKKSPDAVNLWIGDSRAITSLHKDFYENIFCVIDGHKDFILIPPTNLPCLTYKTFPVAKFCNVTPTHFDIKLQRADNGHVDVLPWLTNDPLEDIRKVPFSKACFYRTRVKKGETLYLPSLWFHHVRQSHGCMAVNYWYDMEFDAKYCYYKLLEDLSQHSIKA